MFRKLRYLEWDEFDVAVYDIADYFNGVKLTGVYGEQRGGLPLAVALSHKLSIPYLESPIKKCLWVDDVVETGSTIKKYFGLDLYYASWFGPDNMSFLYKSELINKNEWLVFPWEDQSKAKKDMEEYELSRK